MKSKRHPGECMENGLEGRKGGYETEGLLKRTRGLLGGMRAPRGEDAEGVMAGAGGHEPCQQGAGGPLPLHQLYSRVIAPAETKLDHIPRQQSAVP